MSKIGGPKNILAVIILFAAVAGWSWVSIQFLPLFLVIALNLTAAWLLGRNLRIYINRKIDRANIG